MKTYLTPILIFCVITLATLLPCATAKANNVLISNPSLENITANSHAYFEFDVSWENSWRTSSSPSNWDAVWIFAKFRVGSGNWQHASLHSTDHTAPSGTQISVGLSDPASAFNSNTNPGVGVFLFRDSDGSGTMNVQDARLRWNFNVDGVTNSDTIDFKLFAVEVVFIPEGAFYAGDNATSTSSLRQGSSDNDPWYIGDESQISVQNISGSGTGVGGTNQEYYYVTDNHTSDDATGSVFTIPAAFPKGYKAIYVMKYEVTQSQWVDFFNTLTDTQKTARDVTGAVDGAKNTDNLHIGNNVSWTGGSADATLNGGLHGNNGANFLSWADSAAFLDWSGLRPMTELELEKVARGANQSPVGGEYPWGTTSIVQTTGVDNLGTATETASNSGANCVYDNGITGPVRAGAFATSTSTREDAGASFYGVMEMAGNLWERPVTIGNSTGRAFDGRHGDGTLTAAGEADVTNWPVNGIGSGFRLTGLEDDNLLARLSDRTYAAYQAAYRTHWFGVRGVRTAP